MTKIKMCGLSREEDILTANEILPDYIGFIFAKKSHRYVTPERAAELKCMLASEIQAVGVFVNMPVEEVAGLVESGTIDVVQLHGSEDEAYIAELRRLVTCPVFQAFRVDSSEDVDRAVQSSADLILVDSGAGGTGTCFDWSLVKRIERPFFLAGGLSPDNAARAVAEAAPYGLDVSSGIETDKKKDPEKMHRFAAAVRGCDR